MMSPNSLQFQKVQMWIFACDPAGWAASRWNTIYIADVNVEETHHEAEDWPNMASHIFFHVSPMFAHVVLLNIINMHVFCTFAVVLLFMSTTEAVKAFYAPCFPH